MRYLNFMFKRRVSKFTDFNEYIFYDNFKKEWFSKVIETSEKKLQGQKINK